LVVFHGFKPEIIFAHFGPLSRHDFFFCPSQVEIEYGLPVLETAPGGARDGDVQDESHPFYFHKDIRLISTTNREDS